MADTRLEITLLTIARRYAPPLVPPGWQRPGDYPAPLPELARALASYNVLVLLGDLPNELTHQAGDHFKQWAEAYKRFYSLLCDQLFPSFTQINAFYADQDWPPIVALQGAATPVIVAMAGYVAPFIAARQTGGRVSDVELVGLMDVILDDLEAGDLPRAAYRQLRDDGAAQIKTLLASPVRQLPLTPRARPLFGEDEAPPPLPLPEDLPTAATLVPDETLTAPRPTAPPPPDLPEAPPPSSLPEQGAAPTAPSELPVPFDLTARHTPRKPPVPDLPEDGS